jgi:hypothetical protein
MTLPGYPARWLRAAFCGIIHLSHACAKEILPNMTALPRSGRPPWRPVLGAWSLLDGGHGGPPLQKNAIQRCHTKSGTSLTIGGPEASTVIQTCDSFCFLDKKKRGQRPQR